MGRGIEAQLNSDLKRYLQTGAMPSAGSIAYGKRIIAKGPWIPSAGASQNHGPMGAACALIAGAEGAVAWMMDFLRGPLEAGEPLSPTYTHHHQILVAAVWKWALEWRSGTLVGACRTWFRHSAILACALSVRHPMKLGRHRYIVIAPGARAKRRGAWARDELAYWALEIVSPRKESWYEGDGAAADWFWRQAAPFTTSEEGALRSWGALRISSPTLRSLFAEPNLRFPLTLEVLDTHNWIAYFETLESYDDWQIFAGVVNGQPVLGRAPERSTNGGKSHYPNNPVECERLYAGSVYAGSIDGETEWGPGRRVGSTPARRGSFWSEKAALWGNAGDAQVITIGGPTPDPEPPPEPPEPPSPPSPGPVSWPHVRESIARATQFANVERAHGCKHHLKKALEELG